MVSISLRRSLAAGLAVSLVGLAPAALPAAAQAEGAPQAAAAAPVTVGGLTVNGRTDPLGIAGDAPSLGWKATSADRGVVQSAYQVEVAEAGGGAPLWDSGKVASDRQVDVAYDGPALTSATGYTWRVRTWDGADVASDWSPVGRFETGLLTAGDWEGEWIGDDAESEVARWSDYTASVDFRLTNLAFGLFFRGENPGNAYMWQVTVADGTPRLKVHRRVNGGYTVLENTDISAAVTREQLLGADHTLDVTVTGDEIVTTIDGTEIDRRTDATHARGYVGLRTGRATEGDESARVRDVTVTAADGTRLLNADFEGGDNPFGAGTVDQGDLVLRGESEAWYSPTEGLPLLRTEFATEPGKRVASARVHATARGVYEMRLNGEKVGDQHLAPGSTDYPSRIQSQTYDVTDQVVAGENALGAELGQGWYAGRNYSIAPGYYGSEESLLAQLTIDYTDGTSQTVATDDGWTSHDGPYELADNIEGETYDARGEQPGYDTTDFDATGWTPAGIVDDPEVGTDKVVPQPDEPVRTVRELDVVERTEPAPDAHVYDLGQNMVGVVRLPLTGEAGDTVRLRYAEELNPDGTMYTANLRSARATDYYTFAEDGTVTYEPKFTFHGFRYLEVTGVDEAPAAADVTGVVWSSDLTETGTLETGDPMLDQLTSNIGWGLRGNFLSIPTDTPARDERLGWTGDINVFAPTASYLTDTRAFLGKWMDDLRDSQMANGGYPAIAPNFGFARGGTAWEDAGITVPYAVWQGFGDTAILRRNWESMTRFMDYTETTAGPDLIDDGRDVYGDWLHLDDATPAGVLGTAYLAENNRMMAELAAALGEDEQAEAYAARSEAVRAAFAEAFVAADGTVSGNSQAAYAMALGMDLVPDAQRDAVGARFVAKLESRDMHLSTGFVGTPWLLPALSSIDRDDLAWRLLTNTTYPSWGYEIENGATTMWERWNSIMPDGSFGDVNMNSFNHYAYGAVGDWMYRNIGAIAPAEAGYKVSRIRPNPGRLTSGSGRFESAYGRIATDWELTDEGMRLAAEVPVGTTAEVVLPAETSWAVTEGGSPVADADGVNDATTTDGEVTVTVGSGRYDFEVRDGAGEIGAVLDAIVATDDRTTDLVEAGDLSQADGTEVGDGLQVAYDAVLGALGAELDGDGAAREAGLRSGLAAVRDLRAWLAASAVDRPVRLDLDRRLSRVETLLDRLVAQGLGVSVGLPPVGGVVAGEVLTGTVEVVNTGSVAVTGATATVRVDGWEPVTVEAARIEPGATAQLPVSLRVPADAEPGSYDAVAEVVVTRGDEELRISESTPDWVSVSSGLTVGEPRLETLADSGDPAERAVLEVPVGNAGGSPVRGHVVADLPTGWGSVPSAPIDVPAGAEVVAEVPVTLPLDLVDGSQDVAVEVRDAGVVLATGDGNVTATALPVPPTATPLDHVDFGDGASEQAHAVQAAPSSGTNVEAGLTRRYANTATPGAWFSAELDVTPGEPFLVRGLETFAGVRTKRYGVLVDGVEVATQVVPRLEDGEGTKTWDLLVDEEAVLANDGTVRLRFQFPEQPNGFADPSLADVWTLPVADDTLAPVVGAAVASGPRGTGGWYRGDVTVDVEAADGRPDALEVESGEDAGWAAVTGPVAVTGEGRHTLAFRAADTAGNSTGQRALEVGVDATAPATELRVGDGGSDGSTAFELVGTDALSGIASTAYRVDDGAWALADGPVTVEGLGDHVVEYASTDRAGNVEPMRRTTITLADVDELAPTAQPQVLGTARFGQRLTASPGSWNTEGVSFAYQWLRAGRPIAGATSATRKVQRADLGARLAVRVTASKPGLASRSVTSVATAPVRKAAATATLVAGATAVRAGSTVRTVVRVTAPGPPPPAAYRSASTAGSSGPPR